MSEIVIDANIAAASFFQLQYSLQAREALAYADRILAPDLIVHELTSAAWKLVASGRIDISLATEAVSALDDLVTELVDGRLLAHEAIRLATELRHSSYDCFYVALSVLRQATLLTADIELATVLSKSAHAPRVRLVRGG